MGRECKGGADGFGWPVQTGCRGLVQDRAPGLLKIMNICARTK